MLTRKNAPINTQAVLCYINKVLNSAGPKIFHQITAIIILFINLNDMSFDNHSY